MFSGRCNTKATYQIFCIDPILIGKQICDYHIANLIPLVETGCKEIPNLITIFSGAEALMMVFAISS